MLNGGPARSLMIIYHHTERGMNSTHLHSGLCANYNGILSSHCRDRAWRTSLFGSACWFMTASCHRFSLTTTATNISRGRQTSSRSSAPTQLAPSRGMLYSPDRPGHMAYGQSKHIDQRQPQRAGGARAGMRDQRGPQSVSEVRCKEIHIAGFRARRFCS